MNADMAIFIKNSLIYAHFFTYFLLFRLPLQTILTNRNGSVRQYPIYARIAIKS